MQVLLFLSQLSLLLCDNCAVGFLVFGELHHIAEAAIHGAEVLCHQNERPSALLGQVLRYVGEGAAVVGLAPFQLRLQHGDVVTELGDVALQRIGLGLDAVHEALVVVDLSI